MGFGLMTTFKKGYAEKKKNSFKKVVIPIFAIILKDTWGE